MIVACVLQAGGVWASGGGRGAGGGRSVAVVWAASVGV